jgi:hypothetical protein
MLTVFWHFWSCFGIAWSAFWSVFRDVFCTFFALFETILTIFSKKKN